MSIRLLAEKLYAVQSKIPINAIEYLFLLNYMILSKFKVIFLLMCELRSRRVMRALDAIRLENFETSGMDDAAYTKRY